jgi:nicotinamide-nucleotide amidase
VKPDKFLEYLQEHQLHLTTAEFRTKGRIVSLLAEVSHCDEALESGYVIYSTKAKQRLLGISLRTVEHFNLTNNEVARKMALGALRDGSANSVIATTDLCGAKDVNGKPIVGYPAASVAQSR